MGIFEDILGGVFGGGGSTPSAPKTKYQDQKNYTPVFKPSEPVPIENPNIYRGIEPVREQLAKDISSGQQLVNQTQKNLGIKSQTAPQTFAAKGYKIGNTVVEKAGYDNMINVQNKVINQYLQSSGEGDNIDLGIKKQALQDRMNQLSLSLLEKGEAFNAKLKAAKVSDAERRRAAALWGNIAATVGGGAIGYAIGGPAGAGVGMQAGSKIGAGVGSKPAAR